MPYLKTHLRFAVSTVFLWVFFFFSGFSSLLYQICWQRLLTVNYGVGMISMTLIVSIYMFGLGVGALIGGHWATRFKDKILLYFWIELALGILGLLSFPFLLLLEKHTAGSPYLLAAFYEFLFLSLPTILMGMTLPLLTHIFSRLISDFLKVASVLYFVNTIGAALGALVGCYLLISFWGLDKTIYVAAGINLILACGILSLKFLIKDVNQNPANPAVAALVKGGAPGWERRIPWLVFVTGFLAIGYEIVWLRLIGVLVKSSPYAFSSTLFVYLIGIALGSLAMGGWARGKSWETKRRAFFTIQIAIAVSVALLTIIFILLTQHTIWGEFTRYSLSQKQHPPIFFLFQTSEIKSLQALSNYLSMTWPVLIWPFFFVLLPTLWIGASFPLIADLALVKKGNEAKTIARVYFFNIVGNVLGGMVTGFILLPRLGSEYTLMLFIAVGFLFAVGLTRRGQISPHPQMAFILLVALIFSLLPHKGELYRLIHLSPGPAFKEYLAEGIDGVIMTYQNGPELTNYINGQNHGGRPAHAFYLHAIKAAEAAQNVDEILVIGYGTGSVAEAALKIPGVKKVTVVELSRTLMWNLGRLPLFRDLLSDPRLEFVFDDGRRFLRRTHKAYDIVFMSPLSTMEAYSNNLYSQQFFELVNSRLKPDGLLVSWTDELEVQAQTLLAVFKDVHFHFVRQNEGFFITSPQPIVYWNVQRPYQLISSFPPDEQDTLLHMTNNLQTNPKRWLIELSKGFPVNQDWRPVGEYFIGLQWKKTTLFSHGLGP